MNKLYRFQRGTIKSCDWFINIEKRGKQYSMWKGLLRRDDFEIIQEYEEKITKEQADDYIKKNEGYLIEVRKL